MAHVGDSGAFCVRDGAARRLTMDHKPTNPAEQKRIANAGGTVRHLIICPVQDTHQSNQNA